MHQLGPVHWISTCPAGTVAFCAGAVIVVLPGAATVASRWSNPELISRCQVGSQVKITSAKPMSQPSW